jgi:hypothetical protein
VDWSSCRTWLTLRPSHGSCCAGGAAVSLDSGCKAGNENWAQRCLSRCLFARLPPVLSFLPLRPVCGCSLRWSGVLSLGHSASLSRHCLSVQSHCESTSSAQTQDREATHSAHKGWVRPSLLPPASLCLRFPWESPPQSLRENRRRLGSARLCSALLSSLLCLALGSPSVAAAQRHHAPALSATQTHRRGTTNPCAHRGKRGPGRACAEQTEGEGRQGRRATGSTPECNNKTVAHAHCCLLCVDCVCCWLCVFFLPSHLCAPHWTCPR